MTAQDNTRAFTVFSTHPLHPAAQAGLSGHAELVVATALDADTLIAQSRQADIVIVRAPLPPLLFNDAPRLRAAIRHGAGLDMIPIDAATSAGVLVANVPAVNARSVAEHVIFMAQALLRRFRLIDRDLRTHGWLAGRAHADLAHELAGRTIGIVGMGAIGQAVARIAHQGYGLRVLGNSRSSAGHPAFVEPLALDPLVAEADVLVLACPLTPETTGLIDARRIAAMKPGAVLINVSRGAVVEDAPLIEALRSGRLLGAALDVFVTQPLPPDHPYLSLDNVIVTPHLAGITEESMMRMGTGAVAEAIRVLGGDLPLNLRNPEVVDAYRRRFPV